MNREIKFRGKSLFDGQWVVGDLLHPSTGARIVNYTESEADGVLRADYHYFNVDPSTVGQYTGLKDRSGQEVYEGDVVFWIMKDMRGRGRGEQGAIIWDKHTMSWAILRDKPCADGRPCIISRPFERKYLEVVGNIHDNPELINN